MNSKPNTFERDLFPPYNKFYDKLIDIELPKVEDYKDYTSKTIYVDIKEDKPQEDYFKITC